jgi:hypothetical protein
VPLGVRLTTSTAVGDHVAPTDEELLAQAKRIDTATTLDELTAARLIASERGDGGTAVEWACIVDAELNRATASKRTLYQSLTRGAAFGSQGARRPASTRLDAHQGQLAIAREVLSGRARGIARGAVRFFDPLDANAEHRRYAAWLAAPNGRPAPARVCDALTILERWSFDLPFERGATCVLDRSRPGRDTQAWVGPIPDVDARRLMLFAPLAASDPRHGLAYQQARALLTSGGVA